MPTLSINYGLSDITAVCIDDLGDLSDISIGYPYSRDLFAHFYSEQEYYTDIFNHILKKLKIHKTDLKVIATGFPHIPAIGYEYSSALTLDKLFKLVDKCHIVCADNCSIFTQDTFISLQNLNNLGLGEQEKNYLANLYVYKNAYPTTLSHYNLLFANIWHIVNSINGTRPLPKMEVEYPLLFLGDIFSVKEQEFTNIAYLYMVSLIRDPGIYYLTFDQRNLFPHFVHLAAFNNDFTHFKDDYSTKELGTLINSPGNTSCLIETEVGTSQLVEVSANRMFFVPMKREEGARIVVKSELLGSFEKKISGGDLGLIIDTRSKHDTKAYTYSDLQQDINANLKNINEVLNQL
ncbi:hypothetical protein ACFL0C_01645 [Patescibacteria group bacterium]